MSCKLLERHRPHPFELLLVERGRSHAGTADGANLQARANLAMRAANECEAVEMSVRGRVVTLAKDPERG